MQYSRLPNTGAGWNKLAGWPFLKFTVCLFGKTDSNKGMHDGTFPKKVLLDDYLGDQSTVRNAHIMNKLKFTMKISAVFFP